MYFRLLNKQGKPATRAAHNLRLPYVLFVSDSQGEVLTERYEFYNLTVELLAVLHCSINEARTLNSFFMPKSLNLWPGMRFRFGGER